MKIFIDSKKNEWVWDDTQKKYIQTNPDEKCLEIETQKMS